MESDFLRGQTSRWVLLRHEVGPALPDRDSHWDLMLQKGDFLLTWEVHGDLSKGGPFLARRIANHRLKYLDFEGPLDGNRGTVSRVVWGSVLDLSQQGETVQATLVGEAGKKHLLIIRYASEGTPDADELTAALLDIGDG